jgi:hypothetical protein
LQGKRRITTDVRTIDAGTAHIKRRELASGLENKDYEEDIMSIDSYKADKMQ